MKRPSYFVSLLAIAAMTSCSSEYEEHSTSIHSVTATFQKFKSEETGTRSVIYTDADDHLSYKWAVGDILGIFPDEGTQVEFKLTESSLSSDGLSATFDGGAWALKNGHNYYAYFPFSYDCFSPSIDKTNIPIDYTGQNQESFNDATNAGQYDFNAAGCSSSTTGSLSFDFRRLGALLRLKLTIPETTTYQSLTLSTDGDVIPVNGTIDLTASSIAFDPSEYASSLSISLNNAQGTMGESAYIYVMLPPMALKSQDHALYATLAYGNGKSTVYNLCTSGTETANTPDFKADYIYKRDLVYSSGDPVGTISGGNEEEVINPFYSINGVEYPTPDVVDLGLPSGTKWASWNIGADSIASFGALYNNREDINPSYFVEGIKLSDYGLPTNWQLPTLDDYKELFNNCEVETYSLSEDDCLQIAYQYEPELKDKNLVSVGSLNNITQAINGIPIACYKSKINGNKIYFPAIGDTYYRTQTYYPNSEYPWEIDIAMCLYGGFTVVVKEETFSHGIGDDQFEYVDITIPYQCGCFVDYYLYSLDSNPKSTLNHYIRAVIK